MIKICTQTNVAEVDDSVPNCEKFILTDCIILEDAISYLALPVNSTMTEVIYALLASLIDARNTISILDSRITILETT